MKQEPQNVEAVLSHAIKLQVFEQSPAYQRTLVDHDDGHATRQQCNVCAVTGQSEAGKTVALRNRDLRSFEIRIRIGCPIRFDSKVMGRFENFRIESVVPDGIVGGDALVWVDVEAAS